MPSWLGWRSVRPVTQRRGWDPPVGGVLSVVFVCCVLGGLVWPAHGRQRYWTGNVSNLWSVRGNWDPDEAPPQDGDELLFFYATEGVSDPDPMFNDLVDLKVKTLDFNTGVEYYYPGAPNWELDGNALTVLSSLESYFQTDSESIHINCGLRLGGDAKFAVAEEWQTEPNFIPGQDVALLLNGPIDLNGHTLTVVAGIQSLVEISSVISGTGDIIAKGTEIPGSEGVVKFSGPQGNTFHGSLTVEPASFYGDFGDPAVSAVRFNKALGVAVNDAVRVSRSSLSLDRPEQIGDNATVTIAIVPGAGGNPAIQSVFRLNGHSETIANLEMDDFPIDSAPSLMDIGGAQLTVLSNITCNAGDASVVPTIKGALLFSGPEHTITVLSSGYAGLDMQGQINGLRSVSTSVKGNAALILERQNNYLGQYIVGDSAILDVRDDHAIVGGSVSLQEHGSLTLGNTSINGITLNVIGDNPVTPDLTGSLMTAIGTSAWNGPIQLFRNLVVVADNTFLRGQISGEGGIELLNGKVQLGGGDANTFTGVTLVRCSLLELAKPPNVEAYAGRLVVGGGFGDLCEARWLNNHQHSGTDLTIFSNGLVNLNNHNEDFGPVTFNGGRVETGNGQFAFYQPLTVNPAQTPAVIDGFLGLPPPGNAVFNVGDGTADPDLLVHATVFGAAELVIKRGPGTMRFDGSNTYSGPTRVDQGALQVANTAALGASVAGTVVETNATLQVIGSANIQENITISGALSIADGGTLTLNGLRLEGNSDVNVGTGAILNIEGAIGGGGNLRKDGAGTLSFGGTVANTYDGDTIVVRGTLLLNKPTGIEAVPGRLIIGPGAPNSQSTVKQLSSFTIVGSVTVDRGGLWDLNGQAEGFSVPDLHGDLPLTLRNGGRVQTGSGIVFLPVGGDILVSPGTLGASTFSGRIGLDPGPHHFTVLSRTFGLGGPECTINAVISQTSTAGTLIKDGAGTLVLASANTYTGDTVVSGGTLQVDGLQPQSLVQVNSGTLQGAGSVGPLEMNDATAVVAPRGSPTSLTCGNFNGGLTPGGILQVNLNGPKPGSGYDQLVTHGFVTLSNISLDASLNFSSAINDQFTILRNEGSLLVNGTFNDLPQDATFTVSDETFLINYHGGDGNDVVLTHVSPLTQATAVWSNDSGGDWNSGTNWSIQAVPNGLNAAITNRTGIPYAITNDLSVAVAEFFYSNPVSTIGGGGDLTISKLFTWQGGWFGGSGKVTANGGLHLSGPASSLAKVISGKTLINSGAALWSDDGTLIFNNGALLSNPVGGTFDCAGDGSIENGPGANQVSNAGLFRKTGGLNATRISVAFNNSGTVDVQSGTLSLNGGGTNTGAMVVSPGAALNLGAGVHAFLPASTLTGQGHLITSSFSDVANLAGLVNVTGSNLFTAGTINVTGNYICSNNDLAISASTLNLNGSGTIAPSTLTLGSGGTLGGFNLVTVSGPMTLASSCSLSGSNNVIANGGLTFLPGGFSVSGRTLANTSTAVWTNNTIGAITFSEGAVLSNAPGAVFDCFGPGIIQNSSGANKVVNLGLFRRNSDTNETTIDTAFDNGGTVSIQSGTLNLRGGGTSIGDYQVLAGAALRLGGSVHDFDPVSSITGAGDFGVSGGTANLAGLVNVSGTHTFGPGTANITGNYNCVSNTLIIAGGRADFNGTGLIAPAELTLGVFGTLGGSNFVTVSGPMTLNSGCVIEGGNAIIADGGLRILGGVSLTGRTFVNRGAALWTNSGIVSMTFIGGAVLSNAPGATFDCALDGEFATSVGANAILNAGTFRKVAGDAITPVRVPFINSGTLEVRSGTLSFISTGNYTQTSGLTLLHGGTIANSSPLRIMGGRVKGNGLISGSVINSGIVSPGESLSSGIVPNLRLGRARSSSGPGSSPGQIFIAGDYTQTADGVLEIVIGGTNAITDFNSLIVSNTVTLGGTLNVSFANGFYPPANSTFSFLGGSQVIGAFDNINVPFRDVGLALTFSGTSAALQVMNVRPSIAPISDQKAPRLSPFTLAVQATDDDLPAQTLHYALVDSPPAAQIDTNGVVTWTPTAADPATNVFTVLVTDNGSPHLTASRSFQVLAVNAGGGSSALSLQTGVPGPQSNTVTFSGTVGSGYVTEFATNILGPWFSLGTNSVGTNGDWSIVDPNATNFARFYRARSVLTP